MTLTGVRRQGQVAPYACFPYGAVALIAVDFGYTDSHHAHDTYVCLMTSLPLYKEVRDQIVESLVHSEWQPGELLPSEKELAKRFAVAISTIRAAIGELVSANILVRKQGKGTFVAHHSDRGSRYRFFNVMRNGGGKEPFVRTLLSIKREKANGEALRAFEFPAGRSAEVFRVRMKLNCRGPAFAVADGVVPAHLFPNLDRDGIPDGNTSLYAMYQERFGVNIVRVAEELYAVKASAWVAKALSMPTGEPLLEVRRTGYTFNEVAVEQRTTWIHTQDYHYVVTQGAQG
jgi:GntR family transcriptional regulator